MIDPVLVRSLRWLPVFSALVLCAGSAFAQGAEDTGEDWHDESSEEAEPAEQRLAPEPLETADQGEYAERDPRALTDFRDQLDPNGVWVDDPKYGTVWIPHSEQVGPDFAPYVTNGHWALDDEDNWIWVSGYSWGWVVFHYGRWVWIPTRGWAWVPGRKYAPAWVVWRVPSGSHAYVGWAPMPPDYGWYGGTAVTITYSTYYPYVFCPSPYVFSFHVHRHIIYDRHYVHVAARNTRVYRSPARAHARRYGPPTRVARVPPRSIPRKRATADPRAVNMSRRASANSSPRRTGPVRPGGGRRSVARATPGSSPRALQRPAPRRRLSQPKSLGYSRTQPRPVASAPRNAPAQRRSAAPPPRQRAAPAGRVQPRANHTAPQSSARPTKKSNRRRNATKMSTPSRRSPSTAPRHVTPKTRPVAPAPKAAPKKKWKPAPTPAPRRPTRSAPRRVSPRRR